MSGEAKENSPHKNRSADRRIENTTCVRVPHCVLYLNIQKKAVSGCPSVSPSISPSVKPPVGKSVSSSVSLSISLFVSSPVSLSVSHVWREEEEKTIQK